MKFYVFDQNNSGGYYKGPEYVIVESDSYTSANHMASTIGPCYFDGAGDCRCCGNRWYALADWHDSYETLADALGQVRNPGCHVMAIRCDGAIKHYNQRTKGLGERIVNALVGTND